MDFVVVRLDTRADGTQRIFHPASTPWGKHSSYHNELVMLGDLSQLLGPGSIYWFGDVSQWQPEASHSRLRKDHELCTALRGLGGLGRDDFKIFLRICSTENLRNGHSQCAHR
jgi:hypothetical protein